MNTQEYAKKLFECLKVESDGSIVTVDGPFRRDLHDLLDLVEKEVDDKSAADWVHTALDAISGYGDDEFDPYEYAEPDVYSSDLNDWAGAHWRNRAWCNSALQGNDFEDMDQLYAAAQGEAMRWAMSTVLDYVRDGADWTED